MAMDMACCVTENSIAGTLSVNTLTVLNGTSKSLGDSAVFPEPERQEEGGGVRNMKMQTL